MDGGGAAAPVVVAVRELVGDGVVDEGDAEDEMGDAGEDEDGEDVPLFEVISEAVELEVPVGKLVILGPQVCGVMASFDVILKTGVLAQSSPAKFSSCM